MKRRGWPPSATRGRHACALFLFRGGLIKCGLYFAGSMERLVGRKFPGVWVVIVFDGCAVRGRCDMRQFAEDNA